MLNYAELTPDCFPINLDAKLTPDTVYFLRSSGSFSTTVHVYDLSQDGRELAPFLKAEDFTITDEFRQSIESAVKNGNISEIYTLSKKAFLNTTFDLRASSSPASAAPLASISRSLLSLGKQTFSFPSDSSHSDHEISIAAVGVGRSSQMFVKDSVPYFWDMMGGTHGRLYKVVDGKRVRIGEFAVRRSYEKNCVFVLDSQALGEVVGLLSCVALLHRTDSF